MNKCCNNCKYHLSNGNTNNIIYCHNIMNNLSFNIVQDFDNFLLAINDSDKFYCSNYEEEILYVEKLS